MAITQLYNGTNTLGIGSETVLNSVTPNTTDGVYQLVIDTRNMLAGDVLEIRIKEKTIAASSQGTAIISTLSGVQGSDNNVYFSPALTLMHGWDMTLKQTAGTGRTFEWSIRQVA
jgi:flagellar basal body L-ring protein FlgH